MNHRKSDCGAAALLAAAELLIRRDPRRRAGVSVDRFRESLRQQLGFIRNSCESYDRGDRSEGIRIGSSLRTLLHDTAASTSLLKHLGATGIPLPSTCPEIGPSTLAVEGLASITFTNAGMAFEPHLARSSTKRLLPVPQW